MRGSIIHHSPFTIHHYYLLSICFPVQCRNSVLNGLAFSQSTMTESSPRYSKADSLKPATAKYIRVLNFERWSCFPLWKTSVCWGSLTPDSWLPRASSSLPQLKPTFARPRQLSAWRFHKPLKNKGNYLQTTGQMFTLMSMKTFWAVDVDLCHCDSSWIFFFLFYKYTSPPVYMAIHVFFLIYGQILK